MITILPNCVRIKAHYEEYQVSRSSDELFAESDCFKFCQFTLFLKDPVFALLLRRVEYVEFLLLISVKMSTVVAVFPIMSQLINV